MLSNTTASVVAQLSVVKLWLLVQLSEPLDARWVKYFQRPIKGFVSCCSGVI